MNRQVKGKVWFREVSFCKLSRKIAGIFSLQNLTSFEPENIWTNLVYWSPWKEVSWISVLHICIEVLKLYPPPHISIFLFSPSDIPFKCFGLVDICQKGLKKSVTVDRHWAALTTAIFTILCTSFCGMTVVWNFRNLLCIWYKMDMK